RPATRRTVAAARPTFLGLVVGTLLLAASMTPSLIPRHWEFQAAVSGVVAAGGYGFGTLGSHLWRQLGMPEPSTSRRAAAWPVLAVAAPVGVGALTVRGVGWQRELHTLAGLDTPPWWGHVLALVLALIIAMLLIVVARGVRLAARRVGSWLA